MSILVECDNCGQPISPVRLKNLPQANLCLSCKTHEEKKAKDDKGHKRVKQSRASPATEYQGKRPGCFKCKQPITSNDDYYTLIWKGKTWSWEVNYHIDCLLKAFEDGDITGKEDLNERKN